MRPAWSLIQISLFVLCLLLIVPELPGQVSDTWQPVPQDDLALKDNPANPGSSAMLLERQIYTDDEKRIQTERLRIKVFTETAALVRTAPSRSSASRFSISVVRYRSNMA
jgi:hypothetical protein